MSKLKFLDKCSTEELLEVFSVTGINCSLAEYTLRQIAYELIDRGERSEEIRDALAGPDTCKHGRSTSGTCTQCDLEENGHYEDCSSRTSKTSIICDCGFDAMLKPGRHLILQHDEPTAEIFVEAFRLDLEAIDNGNLEAYGSLQLVVQRAALLAIRHFINGEQEKLKIMKDGFSKAFESCKAFRRTEEIRIRQSNNEQIESFFGNIRKFEQTLSLRTKHD